MAKFLIEFFAILVVFKIILAFNLFFEGVIEVMIEIGFVKFLNDFFNLFDDGLGDLLDSWSFRRGEEAFGIFLRSSLSDSGLSGSSAIGLSSNMSRLQCC